MTNQELIDQGLIEGKKSFDHYWAQIRDNFDFERVAKVMAFLDWGWAINSGRKGLAIPDKYYLMEEVYERWQKVYDSEETQCSGGFTISFIQEVGLNVEFTLTSWNAE